MAKSKEVAFSIITEIFTEKNPLLKSEFKTIFNQKAAKRNYSLTEDSYKKILKEFHEVNNNIIDGFNLPNKKYYSVDVLKLPLSDRNEILKLVQISGFLKQYSQLSFYNEINMIIKKLKKETGHIKPAKYDQMILMDNNTSIKGIEFFNDLLRAIINENPLTIEHKPFLDHPKNQITSDEFLIHPYSLKEYNGRWYIFAYTETNNRGLGTYAIDRLIKLTFTKNKVYRKLKELSPEKYFEDIIGIGKFYPPSKEMSSIVKVRIWIEESLVPYIETKKIHSTQFKEPENFALLSGGDLLTGSIFNLQLRPNYELRSLLLGFGNRCKVLEPDFLAADIKNIAKKINENYL